MKNVSRYLMAIMYVAAGINHLVQPTFYLAIMPPWLPYHHAMVLISGICEIVFALLLIPTLTRKVGAWLIIILLLAVFPANIQMAIDYYQQQQPMLWLAIIRLPLQALLIWWAYTIAQNQRPKIAKH